MFLLLISLDTFVLLPNYKMFCFAGTPVLTITAKDRDSGDFGTAGIVYQVMMPADDSFTLEIVATLTLVELDHGILVIFDNI